MNLYRNFHVNTHFISNSTYLHFISCVGLRYSFFLLLLFQLYLFPPHFFRSISSVWIELVATREKDDLLWYGITLLIRQIHLYLRSWLSGYQVNCQWISTVCWSVSSSLSNLNATWFFFFPAVTKAIRSEKSVRGRLSSNISFIQEEVEFS